MTKNRLLKWLHRQLHRERLMHIVCIAIVIVLAFVFERMILKRNFNYTEYIQITAATSLSATYVLIILMGKLTSYIGHRIEDNLKLDVDCEYILNSYHKESLLTERRKFYDDSTLDSGVSNKVEVGYPCRNGGENICKECENVCFPIKIEAEAGIGQGEGLSLKIIDDPVYGNLKIQ